MSQLRLLLVLLIVGCGNSTSTVAGLARIVHGPGASPGTLTRSGSRYATTPIDGHWAISPDQGKVTLVSLTFHDAGGGSKQATLSNCAPTYQRRDASLSSILDCPFLVPSGTYVSVDLGVSTTAQVLINDATNNIYSDPASSTGLSNTAPSGGAQFVNLTVPGPGGSGNVMTVTSVLQTPFVVGTGKSDGGSASVELTIVADMIHTVFIDVRGSSLTFDKSLPQPPVMLVASVTGPGKVEYYSPLGTGKNVQMGLASTGNEAGSVRVFYAPPPQPSFVFHVVPGPSEAFAANPARFTGSNFKPGGYLGLDSTGTACWALPTDFTWASYSQLCTMKVPANVGETASLRCQHLSSVPAPVSGDTYASGCPTIAPDSTTTLTLVAR